MAHPKNLSTSNFSYTLPDESIAAYPLPGRDESKLLVYKNGHIQEDVYRNIAGHLPENALLIFNNTKVIAARMLFQKPSGGVIEIFVLEPHLQHTDIATAMQQKEKACWHCLIGGAGKWKHGQVLHKQAAHNHLTVSLEARIAMQLPGSFSIAFSWSGNLSFGEILSIFGVMPIPPYLKRQADPLDSGRYQTIYATKEGSVAAPTAGLHFTTEVFASLEAKNITRNFVTLHVGAGTFMPVKAAVMEGHTMHLEYIEADISIIRKLADRAPDVFAVGTTSLRTLESLYWMGLKCYLNPLISFEELYMRQWEVYEGLLQQAIPAGTALGALCTWMNSHRRDKLVIQTQLLIAPGYQVKTVRGLITNFHQPHSTLLLLVAALLGDNWRSVYHYALQHNFRFLSYGDGCLLYIPTPQPMASQW